MPAREFLRPGLSRASRPRRLGAIFWFLFLAAAAAGGWRYLSSPALAISRFDIEGARHARTQDLMAALAPCQGRNLLFLNLAPVAARLGEVPWVDHVTVSKVFPDELRVSVVEKIPVALRREDGKLSWLDAGGAIIAPFDPRREPADVPIITAPEGELPAAVTLLLGLQKSAPQYASALSEIWSLPTRGFGMMDSIFRVPVRVMPQDAPQKIRALLALRPEIQSRGLSPRLIDLRFTGRVVLSGAFAAARSI